MGAARSYLEDAREREIARKTAQLHAMERAHDAKHMAISDLLDEVDREGSVVITRRSMAYRVLRDAAQVLEYEPEGEVKA